MADDLRANALINDSLGSALRSGDHALGAVPALLKQVLEHETWRDFVTKRGEHVHHERFAEFVTAKPLRGLGSDVAMVQRIVAGDQETLDLLDQALRNPVGPPVHDNRMVSEVGGTTRSQALRRLRKDAPELHAEVLAGRLSAHGAMVQAGYRPKTVTVPVTRPEAVARSLLKHMSADDIAQLVAALIGAADLSANRGDGTD